MTIPAGNIWCSDCEEAHHDGEPICMVCGSDLVPPPPDEPNNNAVSLLPTLQETLLGDGSPLQRSILDIQQVNRDLQQSGAELRTVVELLQLQIEQVQQAHTVLRNGVQESQAQIHSILGNNNTLRESMETLAQSVSALETTLQTTAGTPPTNPTTLENLPRTLLTPESPFLRQASVRLPDGTVLDCTPATFGALGSVTGTVMISNRGDGTATTFVQRALTAQAEGYSSCIVINHVSDPWPFHMVDSKGVGGDVNIPVVLLRKECGPALLACTALQDVTVTVEPRVVDCCVCAETFAAGQTQIQLRCHHRFHEACALTWLRRHNTCPYCRDQVDRTIHEEQEATEANHATFYG